MFCRNRRTELYYSPSIINTSISALFDPVHFDDITSDFFYSTPWFSPIMLFYIKISIFILYLFFPGIFSSNPPCSCRVLEEGARWGSGLLLQVAKRGGWVRVKRRCEGACHYSKYEAALTLRSFPDSLGHVLPITATCCHQVEALAPAPPPYQKPHLPSPPRLTFNRAILFGGAYSPPPPTPHCTIPSPWAVFYPLAHLRSPTASTGAFAVLRKL